MSIKVMTWVWEHSPHQGTKLLVHLALADFASDDGHCFPSHVTLAKKARCSERWVYDAIDELKRAGYLEITHHGGRKGSTNLPNHYRLKHPAPMNSVQGQVEVDPELRRDLTLNPTSGEPSLKATVSKPLASAKPTREKAAKKERPPDPLWNAFVAVFGYTPETDNERGRWNKAAKQLFLVNAEPDDIQARAARWPDLFPRARLTPLALASNWSLIGESMTTTGPVLCPECEQPLGASHTEFNCKTEALCLQAIRADSA